MSLSLVNRAILGASLLAMVGLSAGCSQLGVGSITPERITKEELRDKLDAYQDNFEATVRRACDLLVDADHSRRFKRLTLIWQMRVLPMSRDAVDQDNPIAGLIDMWVLATRLRLYLTEGDGKELFNPHQEIAIDAARTTESEIADIGALILAGEKLDATRERISAVAGEHPFRGEFTGSQVHTAMETSKDDVLQGVLAIPLVPFRWLGGVDEGAQAIKGFTVVAARLTDVVQGLATDARLQIQLLLLETEDLESIKRALASIEKMSDSSERLATVAEKLPEVLHRELVAAMKEIDENQAKIQSTLKEARELAEQIDRSGKSASDAGQAWAGTAKAIEEMVASFRRPVAGVQPTSSISISPDRPTVSAGSETPSPAGASGGTPDKPAPYDINDYRRTAEALTETAKQLQTLVVELRGLAEDGPAAKRIEEVSEEWRKLLDESRATADGVTDHATWRVIQVALLILTIVALYRVAAGRFARKAAN